MPYSLVPVLPELAVILTGVILLGGSMWFPADRRHDLAYVGIAGLIVAVAALLPAATFAPGPAVGGMVFADGFSLFFKVLFLAIGILVLLMSPEYVRRNDIPAGEFYTLLVFSVLGMMVMASAADIITLWLGLETASIAIYVLAGMLREDDASEEASLKILLNGAFASAVLLFGMSLVYGMIGSTRIPDLAAGFATTEFSPMLVGTALIFLVAGFAFKVSAVPFHMWTPDAYQGAPTPVTAILSVGSKGAAFAGAMRIFYHGMPSLDVNWALLFAVLAVLTMTVGNLSALWQRNVKRMMAYSSVAQAGYVLVGLAVASQAGMEAAMYYLLVYAFMNLGAFAVIIYFSNTKDAEEVDDYRGLYYKAPFFGVALAVFFFSLVGVPLTGGFLGKAFLILATAEVGMLWLGLVLGLNSAISIGYYFGVVKQMFLREAPEEAGAPAAAGEDPSLTLLPEAPFGLQLAITVALVFTVALGVAPQTFLEWAAWAAYIPLLP